MKRMIAFLGILGLALALALLESSVALAGDDDPKLVVGVQCPGAGFTTIQSAVNVAPPGATIRVCPGTYNEQVTIISPVKVKGDNGAVVKPSPMTSNSTNLATGALVAAAVLVKDTSDVTLQGLTVDGANNGILGCGPVLVGIFYRNASGTIQDVAVRNMRLGVGLQGCQSGLGILAQSGGGGTSEVEVDNSSVHDFQKNGITGNEPGTDIRVMGNVVTGIGPTTGAAQNGIQISFGATGRIEGNTAINHIWSPCVSVSQCAFVATDLLIFNSDGVTITNNTVGKSQISVGILGNNNKIQGNTIFDTDVFDGIALFGNNNKVEANTITNSGEAAVFLAGNKNRITGNKINEAPIGVLKMAGSSGNVIEGNRFVNTPTAVQDPPLGRASGGDPVPFR